VLVPSQVKEPVVPADRKTKAQLLVENAALRQRLAELESQPRSQDEVRRLNFELEQRVIERTMELETVNDALQDDIRQRQRVEDMLRRSELRYRTLFESASDAIIIIALDGQIIEANSAACEGSSYSLEELRQKNVADFYAPDQSLRIAEWLAYARRSETFAFETVFQPRDGTLLSLEINSRLIEYTGRPAILAILHDITKRKEAEQALRQYADEQAVLLDSAFQLTSQLSTQDVLRGILKNALQLMTARAATIALYEPERNVLVVTMVYERDRGAVQDLIGTVRRPGEGAVGQAFQQGRTLVINDYQMWEERGPASRTLGQMIRAMVAVPLLGRHAILGVLIITGDERKPRFDEHDAKLIELFAVQAAIALENAQLYERQQEQYRRLQDAQARLIQSEKMSALGRLIASISHEINNPLQAIQGCLSLIREGLEEKTGQLGAEAAGWMRDLDVASAEVQRIATIVQRLRDFYRPARPGLQTIDVSTAIDAVLALAAKQLQHTGIAVEWAPINPPIVITTNADQLKQIILNLVLNAIDAMPGGGRLHVATLLDTLSPNSQSRPAARIDLIDTGHGIAPDNLARIFEPFFTTKDTGSGLGLSISYELVKELGGDMSVMSELGVGTTFTIRLPIAPPYETGV
jgi:PAS domain S-box-containing protein